MILVMNDVRQNTKGLYELEDDDSFEILTREDDISDGGVCG
jgi:hypothetical protein